MLHCSQLITGHLMDKERDLQADLYEEAYKVKKEEGKACTQRLRALTIYDYHVFDWTTDNRRGWPKPTPDAGAAAMTAAAASLESLDGEFTGRYPAE